MKGIESELREALTNLIFNAVDAMPRGGVITLRSYREEDNIVVEVSDEGVGMDAETRRRCLEPFFSTKGERGSGLGLAMVYGIVAERHEGRIEIDSEVGQGTTVRLIFPLRESSSSGDISAGAPTSAPKRLRVLCIDDEPLLRESMQRMLEHGGHQVDLADSGQSGLLAFRSAKAQDKPFDVVITDLGMPYVDGRQVVQAIKRESPNTPVIMLTGWETRARGESDVLTPEKVVPQGQFSLPEPGESPRAGADAILSKPPKVREVLETLRQLTRAKH
jgi:CheY-like chemotaxis protein/anti-sigma regulatory factor (Ser/Thr protein kinase)